MGDRGSISLSVTEIVQARRGPSVLTDRMATSRASVRGFRKQGYNTNNLVCVCVCGGVSFPPTFAQKPVLSVSFTGRQEEAPQQGSPLHPRRGLWVSLMPTVPLASSVSALRRVRLAVGPPHADRLGPRERAAWTVQPLPTSAPQLDELPSGPAWAPGGQGGL